MALAGILSLVVLVIAIVYMLRYTRTPSSEQVMLLPTSQRGVTTTTMKVSLPDSFNQPEGRTFSYTGWLYVKDFSVGYGARRRIFSKGDCPGLYLDATSNSLIVAVKTYSMTETVLISNIPAMKWIHFAIVVNQTSVDIYINGMLRQHHTLSQLPDTNQDDMAFGGEWDGVVGGVSYWSKSLVPAEVLGQSMLIPPPDLEPTPAKPNYFDITWYIGRTNSAA